MMLELNERKKTALYAFGVMHELCKLGLMAGGDKAISPKGLALFDQIKASGWRPDKDELRGCVGLMCGYDEESWNGAMKLIDKYERWELDFGDEQERD